MQKVLIEDTLHRRIKIIAALEGTTIQQYVANAYRVRTPTTAVPVYAAK